jgi:polysaccharide export outer membrane protein
MSRVRIDASGVIQIPYAGEVPAAGRTVGEVQGALREIYEREYLTRAELSISVTEYSPRKVYILGAVEKEGAYEIPTGKPMDLLQLISLAGGFGEDADRVSIVITRRSSSEEFYRVSYGHLLGEGEPRTVLLHPDDTVIVGQQEKVYVFGRVVRAGGFPLEEGGLTVIQAIALAGGFERIASEEGTVVIRKMPGGERRTYRVPVQSIVEDPERMDFPLQSGDIVYVPESLF